MTKEFWEYETEPIEPPSRTSVVVNCAWIQVNPKTFQREINLKLDLSTFLPVDQSDNLVPASYSEELGSHIIRAVNEYIKH